MRKNSGLISKNITAKDLVHHDREDKGEDSESESQQQEKGMGMVISSRGHDQLKPSDFTS